VARVNRERVQRIVLSGDPPDPLNPVSGCHFAGRCPKVDEGIGCHRDFPELLDISTGHKVACHEARIRFGSEQK